MRCVDLELCVENEEGVGDYIEECIVQSPVSKGMYSSLLAASAILNLSDRFN